MKILLKNDPVMDHAHKVYKKFTADDELLQVYEARGKSFLDIILYGETNYPKTLEKIKNNVSELINWF